MKALILSILFFIISGLGFGDTYSVLIKNSEKSTFYYILDPPELSGFDPAGSVFISILYDYFSESVENTPFKELPANAMQRLEDLTEGAHLLVGFFALAGEVEYPVRVLGLQAGGAIEERFYSIYREPSLLAARAGAGRLKGFSAPHVKYEESQAPSSGQASIRIDNQYEDWEGIPRVAAFTEDFIPLSFTREQFGADFEVFPIEQSEYWRDGGTPLNEIKVVADEDQIYLFFSSYSSISDSFSIFLYFHIPRIAGTENRVTVELIPAGTDKPGMVVLWEKGQEPQILGKLAATIFFLEAAIRKSELYQALGLEPGDQVSLDLTTCYFNRAELVYEEFFFATLFSDDIPTAGEISPPVRY